MGLDTHMILETVPVLPPNARTSIRSSNGHHTTTPGPWGAERFLAGLALGGLAVETCAAVAVRMADQGRNVRVVDPAQLVREEYGYLFIRGAGDMPAIIALCQHRPAERRATSADE